MSEKRTEIRCHTCGRKICEISGEASYRAKCGRCGDVSEGMVIRDGGFSTEGAADG